MTFKGTTAAGFTGGEGVAGVDLMQAFLNLTYAWKTADDQFALGASAILALQSFQGRGVAAFSPYTKTYIESYMTTGQPKMPTHLSGNGHDMSYGYGASVGALWNATKWLSVASRVHVEDVDVEVQRLLRPVRRGRQVRHPVVGHLWPHAPAERCVTFDFDYQSIWYSDTPSVSNPIENLFTCPTVGGTNVEGCLAASRRRFRLARHVGLQVRWILEVRRQWTFRAGYSFPDSQPIPKTQMEFNILARAWSRSTTPSLHAQDGWRRRNSVSRSCMPRTTR